MALALVLVLTATTALAANYNSDGKYLWIGKDDTTLDAETARKAAINPCTEIKIETGNSVYTVIDGALYNTVEKTLDFMLDGSRPEEVVIREGIVGIGAYVFCSDEDMKAITLPESLTSIGDSAFYFCSGLTSLILPESLIFIGKGVFRDCSGLTSLTLPESVTSIGARAFSNCTGLTSLRIPASVTEIGADILAETTNITLDVAEGSYAQQYAEENNIPYTIDGVGAEVDPWAWLN